MSVSIVIPCKNEEKIIAKTIQSILDNFIYDQIFEILVIDDFSNDQTYKTVEKYFLNNNKIKIFKNKNFGGLGEAIKIGIENSTMKFVCFFMSDASDSVEDLGKYAQEISKNNLDAVFGSRFIIGSKVIDYPKKKLFLNRIFNRFAQMLFFCKYNDFTNAFKIYKRDTLLKLYPLVSENFNIFLELPLKIISRGYKYKVIPISWNNRKIGDAKFKIKELGSKYFFTLFYCFLEKILLKKKSY
tara:strand:+ start:23729 stop:24454 length:726 start_codon:yes stop_codon:yes gene_type:complete